MHFYLAVTRLYVIYPRSVHSTHASIVPALTHFNSCQTLALLYVLFILTAYTRGSSSEQWKLTITIALRLGGGRRKRRGWKSSRGREPLRWVVVVVTLNKSRGFLNGFDYLCETQTRNKVVYYIVNERIEGQSYIYVYRHTNAEDSYRGAPSDGQREKIYLKAMRLINNGRVTLDFENDIKRLFYYNWKPELYTL